MTELEGGRPRAGEIAPGAAEQIPPGHPRSLPEQTDSLVEMAIESVLEQVPDVPGEEPEANVKYQPWADTAAPPGKNKRPLAELLAEYAARVAADPDAHAARPQAKPPGLAFFDRFGGPRRDRQGGGRGRRSGRGRPKPQPAGASRPPAPTPPAGPPAETGPRRRRRSGRRRRRPQGGGPAPAG